MMGNCGVKGFLSHLTFTSNFAETPTCMGYLWYLALDMQLYLFAPFVLFVLNQRPKVGLMFCIFLIIFSAFLRGLHCRIYNVCNNSDVDIPVRVYY